MNKTYVINVDLKHTFAEFERQHRGWPTSAIPYYVIEQIISNVIDELSYQAETNFKFKNSINFAPRYPDLKPEARKAACALSYAILKHIATTMPEVPENLRKADMVVSQVTFMRTLSMVTVVMRGWSL